MAVVQEISKEEVETWLKQGISANILVAGKMGVGKSTVVNGVVGEEVAVAAKSPTGVTPAVVRYERVVENIYLQVFDTPGLDDPYRDDEDTVREMVEKTEGRVDLLMFCLDIRNRVTRNDIESMKLFTTAFGTQVWTNTVFVLTFANKIEASSESELRKAFDSQVKSYTNHIHNFLREKCNVEESVARLVPVVPAGYYQPTLPGCKDWLTDLWLESFKRIRHPANAAFFKMGAPRFWSETDLGYKPPYMRKLAVKLKSGLKQLSELVIEAWKAGLIQDIIIAIVRGGVELSKSLK